MENLKFRHLRDANHRIVATIATQRDEDRIMIASAVCHSNDIPSRKRGRFICEKRFEAGKFLTMDYEEFKSQLMDGTIINQFTNEYVRDKRGW